MSQQRITRFIIRFIMTSVLLLYYTTGNTAEVRELASQPQIHQSGQFRVLYYTEGKDAISLEDKNRNKVPDQAEDVLTQTLAAYYLFVETLGFPDPFQSRYFQDAKFLDIILYSQDASGEEGELGEQKELAFAHPRFLHVPSDPEDTVSINFRVSSSLKASTDQGPAREFFHLIQYGVTFFGTDGLLRELRVGQNTGYGKTTRTDRFHSLRLGRYPTRRERPCLQWMSRQQKAFGYRWLPK